MTTRTRTPSAIVDNVVAAIIEDPPRAAALIRLGILNLEHLREEISDTLGSLHRIAREAQEAGE